MKRDMDLIRKILLSMESHEHGHAPHFFSMEGFTEEEIGYHCYLLYDAGLINAAEDNSAGSKSPSAIPINLTWHGHEFIANANSDTVWSQAKAVVSKLGNVSFAIWSDVLSQVVKSNLGING